MTTDKRISALEKALADTRYRLDATNELVSTLNKTNHDLIQKQLNALEISGDI